MEGQPEHQEGPFAFAYGIENMGSRKYNTVQLGQPPKGVDDVAEALPSREQRVIRAAIYVRFSSDNQNETSNEDQISACRSYAEQRGWLVVEECIRADSAKTGQTIARRTGLDDLKEMAAWKSRPFDCLIMYHTSRLARDVADSHQLKKYFEFFKIALIFVADALESTAPGFDTAFLFKSFTDQQHSKDLAAHVSKAQLRRFEDGHVPGGGIPYGYRCIPHENPNRLGRWGRPEVDHVDWAIDQEEAKVITFIYESYASGQSYADIAKKLNQQGVKPPRAPRLRNVASWSKSALLEMLKNDRYIGIFRWGQSYQDYHPKTGKLTRLYRDESEWHLKEMPDLRIIPQELWERVCEQRRIRGKAAKQLGGMACSERARGYLVSGLIYCGQCDHKMFIIHTNPSTYGCSDHRDRGTCDNRIKIRQQELDDALLSALVRNLESEDLRDDLVERVKSEITKRTEERKKKSAEAESNRSELTRELTMLRRTAQNLGDAIAQMGLSPTLHSQLVTAEARISAIEEQFCEATRPASPRFTDEQIRAFVDEQSQNFAEALLGDRQQAKEELRKRISKLTLTPQVTEGGCFYLVTGDVGLFVSENLTQHEEGALFGLRYTFPLRFEVETRKPRPPKTLYAVGSRQDTPAAEDEAICRQPIKLEESMPKECEVVSDREPDGGIEPLEGFVQQHLGLYATENQPVAGD